MSDRLELQAHLVGLRALVGSSTLPARHVGRITVVLHDASPDAVEALEQCGGRRFAGGTLVDWPGERISIRAEVPR